MATIAVTEAITSLRKAHELFNLSRESNPAFFPEWQGPLLSDSNNDLHRVVRVMKRLVIESNQAL